MLYGSFSYIAGWYSFMDLPHFICSPIDGNLSCFQLWAMRSKATMNLHVQVLCVDTCSCVNIFSIIHDVDEVPRSRTSGFMESACLTF